MKLFGSRFFILFLILTVSLFFFSAEAAYAGGVIDAIGSVFNAIITVTNTVINAIVGVFEAAIGTIIGSNPISGDGACRLQNLEQNVFQVFGDSCNTSASIVITPTGDGCTFSYQPRFYIPEKDVGFIGGGTQCDRITINENNNNVALYRFVKPSNISQSELSDWYFQIKNTLGNGFLILDDPPTWDQPLYHQSADSGSLVTLPYYTACSGNVCDKIADFSIPPDSYVVYAAKMLGNYIGINTYDYGNGIQCDVYSGLNKFLDTDNASRVLLPDSSAWLGNALVGPIKTGPCPTPPPATPPTASISASPNPVAYNTPTTLTWSSAYATSCTYAGSFWPGASTSGSGQSANLTSNTTFTMQCTGPGGTSPIASVTVNVGGAPSPTPLPASNAVAWNVSCSQNHVVWMDNSDNEDRFGIELSMDGVYWPTWAGWVGPNIQDFDHTGLSGSTRYYYRVMSGNAAGYAVNYSNITSAVTPACAAPVPAPGAPSVSISADNTNLSYNTATTIRWSSSNTTSCTVSPSGWSGTSGAQSTGNLTSSRTYTANCSGPGGSAFDSVTVNVGGAPVPAPTLSFSASPASITQGNSSTLSWNTSNASSCWGSGGGIDGWKSTGGSETVWPSSNTTYYMECWNSAGASSGQKSATVNVSAPPPGNFNLNLGGSISCNAAPLSWTASSGADAYRILRGSSRVDISPYQPYTARNFTDTTVSQNTSYIYQIEAYNDGGTTRSNALNVDTPYCQPTVSFSANPVSIYQGQTSTLSWSSSNSTSCIASGSWSGSKALNGSENVVPLPPPSATYNLTCSGPGGSDSDSATIDIAPLELPDWKEIIPR